MFTCIGREILYIFEGHTLSFKNVYKYGMHRQTDTNKIRYFQVYSKYKYLTNRDVKPRTAMNRFLSAHKHS